MSDHNDDVRGGYPVGDRPPGRNGTSPDERSELPLDLAAVQADDALIDALGRIGSAPGSDVRGSDAHLTQVLLAWRREVGTDVGCYLDEPLVDVDTALAVVARAQRPPPRRRPVLVPFAAAAMAVIAFLGLGLGAKAAAPGDTLWPVTQVLYAEHAQSVEAAVEVRTKLAEAEEALQDGRPAAAEAALRQVERELSVVEDGEGRAALLVQRDTLVGRLGPDAPPPTAGSSTSPAPSQQLGPSAAADPSTSPDTLTDNSTPTVSAEPKPPVDPRTSPDPSIPPRPGPRTGPGGPGEGKPVTPPAPRSDAAPESDAPAAPETAPAG